MLLMKAIAYTKAQQHYRNIKSAQLRIWVHLGRWIVCSWTCSRMCLIGCLEGIVFLCLASTWRNITRNPIIMPKRTNSDFQRSNNGNRESRFIIVKFLIICLHCIACGKVVAWYLGVFGSSLGCMLGVLGSFFCLGGEGTWEVLGVIYLCFTWYSERNIHKHHRN